MMNSFVQSTRPAPYPFFPLEEYAESIFPCTPSSSPRGAGLISTTPPIASAPYRTPEAPFTISTSDAEKGFISVDRSIPHFVRSDDPILKQ